MAHNYTEMVLLTAMLLVGFKAAVAAEVFVGGEAGWTVPDAVNGLNYTDALELVVGDFLVFKNDRSFHSVLSVTEAAFETCNTSEPLREWEQGNIMIKFNKPGRWWFICGIPNHCPTGQAVKVTVTATTRPDS